MPDETFPFLFAAYSVIWTVVFAYLVRLRRREKELDHALDELRDRLGPDHVTD